VSVKVVTDNETDSIFSGGKVQGAVVGNTILANRRQLLRGQMSPESSLGRCGEGFYFAGKGASETPSLGGFDSIFGCLLYGYYTVYYFMYHPPAPRNSPQRYDFTGLTPIN